MKDYDIETIDISTSSSVQPTETQVIDLNIKSESNPNDQEIIKSEPLETDSPFTFFSRDPNPFLVAPASSGDPDFFLGPQTSADSTDTNSDLNDIPNSTPTSTDEKTTSSLDADFIKEELILVRNEIENDGSRTGNKSGWSYKSDKFKCYHCGENFANISSLNAHAAHVHNICIHKCPHCPGDGAKFKFRTHLVEHIMMHHPGKSARSDDSARVQITTDSGTEHIPKNRRYGTLNDPSRSSWFVKTKCEICGEEFRQVFKMSFSLSDWSTNESPPLNLTRLKWYGPIPSNWVHIKLIQTIFSYGPE